MELELVGAERDDGGSDEAGADAGESEGGVEEEELEWRCSLAG